MDSHKDISKDSLHQSENYKQINEDIDSGKREVVDYLGTKIACDIFGLPLKKYFNNISGASDYNLRLRKKLIKEIKYDTKNLYYKLKWIEPLYLYIIFILFYTYK